MPDSSGPRRGENVAIWRRTPGMAWLSHIVGLPAIRQLSGFIYDRFADALYAWNRRKGHW